MNEWRLCEQGQWQEKVKESDYNQFLKNIEFSMWTGLIIFIKYCWVGEGTMSKGVSCETWITWIYTKSQSGWICVSWRKEWSWKLEAGQAKEWGRPQSDHALNKRSIRHIERNNILHSVCSCWNTIGHYQWL